MAARRYRAPGLGRPRPRRPRRDARPTASPRRSTRGHRDELLSPRPAGRRHLLRQPAGARRQRRDGRHRGGVRVAGERQYDLQRAVGAAAATRRQRSGLHRTEHRIRLPVQHRKLARDRPRRGIRPRHGPRRAHPQLHGGVDVARGLPADVQPDRPRQPGPHRLDELGRVRNQYVVRRAAHGGQHLRERERDRPVVVCRVR